VAGGIGASPSPPIEPVVRSTVDGVPVFFVEADGPTVAGLVFRTGIADETVQTRGVSHLVEHLALASIGEQHHQHNGTVDLTTTNFAVRGTPEEAADFFRTVCESLANLPLDRIRLEGRILRTEASQRSTGVAARMAFYRYGFTGNGLSILLEFFLNDPRPEPLVAWAKSRFNRSNCALWIVGTYPGGLSLQLPDGARCPMPSSTQIPKLPLPSSLPGGNDCVAIDYLSPRTSISTTVVRVLMKRLHAEVRQSKGLTYMVAGERTPLSATQAENSIWLTCLEEQAARVRAELMSILDDLATSGPQARELAEDLDGFVRHQDDPDARVQDVSYAAQCEITGMEYPGRAGLLEERRAVTREDCAAELRASLSTSILAAPAAAGKAPPGLAEYPMTCPQVAGEVFRLRAPKQGASESLIVGTEGISRVAPNGTAVTVRWSECVGLALEEDGNLRLMAGDGFMIRFKPDDWERSATVVQKVATQVAPEQQIGPEI
jgi:zinc protease